MFKFILGVGVGVVASNRLRALAEDQISRRDSLFYKSSVKLVSRILQQAEKLGAHVTFDEKENDK